MSKTLTKYGYIISKDSIKPEILKSIKKELTVQPKVNEKYSLPAPPFKVYREKEDTIILPRYYGIKKLGLPDKAINMQGTPINLQFNGSLREPQQYVADKCIDYIRNHGGGLLSLPCGYGKTVVSLYIACKLNLKTLIVVHKTFLQNQWYDRIKQFTNASIGIIKQNKIDVKNRDMVVGMLQSISMKDYETSIFDDFDLVILDEVHHTGSRIFSKAHFKIGARYTLGLSATLFRSDGLTKVLEWHLGDVMHEELRKGGDKALIRVYYYESNDKKFSVKTQWFKGQAIASFTKMTTNLCELEDRNMQLLNILNILRQNPERKILVLSGRLEHLKLLKNKIDKYIKDDITNNNFDEDYVTDYYVGGMKEYQLRESSLANIIFATYAMAEEGLDIPELNTLLLATSKSDVVQSIGRIMRKTNLAVPPLIIDIIDNLSIFSIQGKKRISLYRKRKYSLQTNYLINGKFLNEYEYKKKSVPQNGVPKNLLESLTNLDDFDNPSEYLDNTTELELDIDTTKRLFVEDVESEED